MPKTQSPPKFKVRNNVPLAREETRVQWPFADMKVGGTVDIEDADIWPRAQAYAHIVAKRKGWKITTTWIDDKKFGRIRRLS